MLPVDPGKYGLFVVAMSALAITPGPANIFAIATGIERGPKAAMVAVLGMNAATLVWFVGAALGLGALMETAPSVFSALTFIGGIYVLWLGAKAFLSGIRVSDQNPIGTTVAAAPNRSFRDGFVVQLANPKALVFFSAVLPPFIDTSRTLWPQLMMFAAGTITLDLISMNGYALAGAALSSRLKTASFRRGFFCFVGALLMASGTLILFRQAS
jgi:threonine/homoserine/homoserine lactone efflux protein